MMSMNALIASTVKMILIGIPPESGELRDSERRLRIHTDRALANTRIRQRNATAAVTSIIPITQRFLTVGDFTDERTQEGRKQRDGHQQCRCIGEEKICDESSVEPPYLIDIHGTVFFLQMTMANESTSALVATPITIEVSTSACGVAAPSVLTAQA